MWVQLMSGKKKEGEDGRGAALVANPLALFLQFLLEGVISLSVEDAVFVEDLCSSLLSVGRGVVLHVLLQFPLRTLGVDCPQQRCVDHSASQLVVQLNLANGFQALNKCMKK